jgi:hypothetical protein
MEHLLQYTLSQRPLLQISVFKVGLLSKQIRTAVMLICSEQIMVFHAATSKMRHRLYTGEQVLS